MTIPISIFYLLFFGIAFNGPIFVLSLANGSTVAGPVEQIGDNWSVRLGGVKPVSATGLQAISIHRENTSLPAWPRNEQVILANGDRLPGTVRELSGDRLLVRTDLGKEADLTIPLSAVSVIWVAAPDGVDGAVLGAQRSGGASAGVPGLADRGVGIALWCRPGDRGEQYDRRRQGEADTRSPRHTSQQSSQPGHPYSPDPQWSRK